MNAKAVSNDILLGQLRWRYATKQFDATRKISLANWQTLEESLLLTPSSFGLQRWRFIVVTGRSHLRATSECPPPLVGPPPAAMATTLLKPEYLGSLRH